ncbi:TLC domain-containing protein 2-like isoform X2 [Rhodnius prolixus]|uniref:TLC domain-containing protein 2-like isoform X2 n=1 Tax=Rhodnius prolixus TaxID=13249 RepID=UPI003D18D2CE
MSVITSTKIAGTPNSRTKRNMETTTQTAFDVHNLGYITVLLSSILFYFNNYWVLKMCTPECVKLFEKKEWKWRNTANSLIHSFITGCGACLCFWWTPAMREDLIVPNTMASHLLISFSIGYFIYDLIDMAVNDRKSKTYELIVHHFMVISCFTVSMTQHRYAGYTLMALLVEVNSVFLHVRQLMIMGKISKNAAVYRINNSFNLGTFVVFRVLTLGWMTRWLLQHRSDLATSHFYIAGISLAVIMAMNTILLQRLLNADYRQCQKPPVNDEHNLKAR